MYGRDTTQAAVVAAMSPLRQTLFRGVCARADNTFHDDTNRASSKLQLSVDFTHSLGGQLRTAAGVALKNRFVPDVSVAWQSLTRPHRRSRPSS